MSSMNMKDIDIAVIEGFNNGIMDKKEDIYNFLQGCIIHLDEDLKRLKRIKQEKTYTYLEALYNNAVKEQEKVLKDKPLEIIHILELNHYNQSKTKELKIIAVATVALMLAIVFSSIYL